VLVRRLTLADHHNVMGRLTGGAPTAR
jgi:hypothetical protein